jgi:hypothetical protein
MVGHSPRRQGPRPLRDHISERRMISSRRTPLFKLRMLSTLPLMVAAHQYHNIRRNHLVLPALLDLRLSMPEAGSPQSTHSLLRLDSRL